MVTPTMDMLSVFSTPWHQPYICHVAASRAVRRATSSYMPRQRAAAASAPAPGCAAATAG